MEERLLSDRYRIVKHLARGGMADVYEAEDTLLNRAVAVKVLHANFASDEAFVARFRREAQAAANLSHPNIVAIYDWGKDEGTYFMVMELIRGRTLREVLKAEGEILPQRAAEITAEAAAALSVAHQHGVYHRDIKPGNIMVTDDGSVKVTDFGIARAMDDSEELTRTGAVIGTATYFSPEQAQGLPADERSDVYSLGIVLYEMLAGKPPFTGESPVAVAYQHVSEQAPPPNAINPEAPPELCAVASHAITKSPDQRYQSADDLRNDLLRYLTGSEPLAAAAIMASAPTATINVPPAVPGGVATVVGGGAVSTMDAPIRGRSQTSYWVIVGAMVAILAVGLILIFRLLSGGEAVASTVVIPQLEGVPAEQAFEALQELDLKVRATEEPHESIAAGLVIRTEPPAGSSVAVQEFVTVVVSAGQEQFGIPNVINENIEVARAMIEAQGFTVGTIEYQFTEDFDENIVIDQFPRSGESAAPGTEVNLFVSSGPSSIAIPDVSGKTAETAILELTRAGFTNISTEEEYSPEVLEGFVIDTNPTVGQIVPRDAPITVLVSIGPEPVDVPDLTGKTPAQAQSTLNALGLLLVVSQETVEVPLDSGLIGNVAEQSPSAGETIEVGDTVTVTLGIPNQVSVPDLKSKSIADAQAAAAAVGLNISGTIGEQITNDPAKKNLHGMVASQNPTAGKVVDEGSFIAVAVWVYKPIVPNFVGMKLTDAQDLADELGLVLDVTIIPNPPGPDKGKVISQSIPEMSEVDLGTVIEIDAYADA